MENGTPEQFKAKSNYNRIQNFPFLEEEPSISGEPKLVCVIYVDSIEFNVISGFVTFLWS